MTGGFEPLEVYQAARELRERVYRLARQLPDEEKCGLVSQMRRAAVSMTNCIAEGHGTRSWRHNVSYLYRTRGSVCELQDDFNVCEDESYFQDEHLSSIRNDSARVMQMINGYIKYLNQRIQKGANAKSGKPRRAGQNYHGAGADSQPDESTS